jgi:hypothetical protein
MMLHPNECVLLIEYRRAAPTRDQISSMPKNYSSAAWANPFKPRGWANHFVAVTTRGIAPDRLGHGTPFLSMSSTARCECVGDFVEDCVVHFDLGIQFDQIS